ncbi:cytochrome c, partial [Acinetobacter baumannii]
MSLILAVSGSWSAWSEPAAIYAEHCAACHGADRLGGAGPALVPDSLERLKKDAAIATITGGRAAT